MNNEATVKAIELLIKIAYRQQQIIQKLADVAPPDEHRDANIDYITHQLVPIVASNLGIPNVTAVVDILPSVPSGGFGDGGFVEAQPHKYLAKISGVPKDKEKKFGEAMTRQIQSQKPELAKNFSYTFG